MITQPKIDEETAELLFMAWTDVIHNHGTGFTALSVVQILKSTLQYDVEGLYLTEELCEQFLVELATSNRCLNCGKHNDQSPIEVGADNCVECEES